MRMVYLGLFSSIFNWVFNKILAPIIKFIANILSVVFEFIFNNILMPILTLVFKTWSKYCRRLCTRYWP